MSIDRKSAEMLMDAGISLLNPAPALASRVQSQAHFKAFLMATPLAMRKKAYDAMAPYLSFKPLPYTLMNLGKRMKRPPEPVPKRELHEALQGLKVPLTFTQRLKSSK